MRVVFLVARILAAIFFPILLLGWLWFDVGGGLRAEVLAIIPLAALVLGAFTPERFLAKRVFKATATTLCLVAAIQYAVAAITSLEPRMGPDYYAFGKQIILTALILILTLRIYKAGR